MTSAIATPETISSPIIYPSGQHFSADVAFIKAYGIEEAFIIHHFQHWIRVNKKNRVNYIEDRTWTYQTMQQIADHFEFLNYEQVKYAIERLIDMGVIIKENFNRSKVDKTCWYAFVNEQVFVPDLSDNSKNVYERENSPSTGKIPHRVGKIPEPIPDTKTDTKKKQQQEPSAPSAKPIAAASKNSSKEKKPKFEIPECLAKLAIPIKDMEWICTHFDTPTIAHAVSWVVNPLTKVKTSIPRALKWACRELPEIPSSPEDKILENKKKAEKIISDLQFPSNVRIEVLNTSLEIWQNDFPYPSIVSFDTADFLEKFQSTCKKYNIRRSA